MRLFKKIGSAFWEFDAATGAVERARPAPPPIEATQPSAAPTTHPADMTVEAIYQAAAVSPGPAPKLAKFLESMRSSPREVVAVAVRAFAAADGAWSDADVLRDVEARLQALDGYAALVATRADEERAETAIAVAEAVASITASRDAVAQQVAALNDELKRLDGQLAEAAAIEATKGREVAAQVLRIQGRVATERAAMEAVNKFFATKN